ncbi:NuoI/complex I 23 kDa subunit family protein [Desulfoluna spongiiphila]|uniref:NADH-quinone oxidoreductase subunit I n=1 Tax=Desulfoluna spongiiphila TaxID=419481 RepID=A0A1G5GFD0_9BACT|nr:NADH-quinone oxidoreductase subunit I [Desulfoluna spongiiphila]SCY50057.1 NADH dehydrogenase subunit I [Desulfoluna spongiiphila]VVS93598.1 nadh-quinone oxidoreductase chain i [Desulfoluna spongiiphila]
MSGYFSDLITGSKSLLSGLGVTFKAMVSPVVTVQYPREKIDVTPAIRGHIDLVKDEGTGAHRCIVCLSCMKICPCQCITVEGEKQEGVKGKVLTLFTLDFTKCSLCGLCVESCRPRAIDFCSEYELAGFSREEFFYDLLKRVKERA